MWIKAVAIVTIWLQLCHSQQTTVATISQPTQTPETTPQTTPRPTLPWQPQAAIPIQNIPQDTSIIQVSAPANKYDTAGYRLPPDPTHIILAPRKIRPNSVMRVSVTILKMVYPDLEVRVYVTKNRDEQIAKVTEKFFMTGMKTLSVRIPKVLTGGNYRMRVEGFTKEGGILFQNQTDLLFDLKQLSMFIQISKPLYQEGNTVRFRIVPFKPDLMPAIGPMDIFVKDPTGTIIRRWLNQHTNHAGLVSMSFDMEGDEPTFGWWQMLVTVGGYNYTKEFWVEDDQNARWEVFMDQPKYIFENDFGISGWFEANYSDSGYSGRGNGTMTITIKPPGAEEEDYIEMIRPLYYFGGRQSYLITMQELKDKLLQMKPQTSSRLRGGSVTVSVEIYEWFLVEAGGNDFTTFIYSPDPVIKFLGDKIRTFKPGMEFTINIAAMMHDGKPVTFGKPLANVTFEVVTRTTGQFRIPTFKKLKYVSSKGIVSLVVKPNKEASLLTIRAYYGRDAGTLIIMTASRQYSPTNSYLRVTTSTKKPRVNEFMIFQARSNTHIDKLYYQIVSAGELIISDFIQPRIPSNQMTFSIALSKKMAPSSRIVAYFLRQDAEIVADSLNFFVDFAKNQHDVGLTINRGKDFSGDTFEVKIKGGAYVFVGSSGVIADWYEHGGGYFSTLTMDWLIKELMTYDNHANLTQMHTWNWGYYNKEVVTFATPSYAIDANTTFSFSGLNLFTDAVTSRVVTNCNYTLGFLSCFDGSCFREEQWCNDRMDCADGFDEMNCPERKLLPEPEILSQTGWLNRNYVDEEWLWLDHLTRPWGSYITKVNVPFHPAQMWYLHSFSVSRYKGLGIAKTPIKINTIRTFYIQVEAPERIVRGEQVGVRVSAFNYWHDYLEALIQLEKSDDYEFVHVEPYGRVRAYNPRTSKTSQQVVVYLAPGEGKIVHFPVLPQRTGDIDVTITGSTFIKRDSATVTINVIPIGIRNGYSVPFLINLLNQGSVLIPNMKSPVPEQFQDPNSNIPRYVPGTEACSVTVTGDVLGSYYRRWTPKGERDPIEYLRGENLYGRPSHNGEATVSNFASNLYSIMFLKITQQLDKDTEKMVLEQMVQGFSKILRFMRPDGSMLYHHMPGADDEEPSVWLTAIAAKVLAETRMGEWERILFIPTGVLNKMVSWLCKQQNPSGAFHEATPLYDRKMMANNTWDGTKFVQKNVSLTATVLMALVANDAVTGEARTCLDGAKSSAQDYLNRQIQDIMDPYQMALVTLALERSGSNKKNDAFQRLRDFNRTDVTTYWSFAPFKRNPTFMQDALPVMKWRVAREIEGYSNEATAYALLVYLIKNQWTDAMHIMSWLQTVRNGHAGWRSSRDTLAVIEALSQFGMRDRNRRLYDMRVTVESTNSGNWKKTVVLDKDNFNMIHSIRIPSAFGSVRAYAEGTGLAVMRLACRMNVEFTRLIRKGPRDCFELDIDQLQFSGKNYSIMHMKTCARWTQTTTAIASGVAVMDIQLPSGYYILDSDMDDIALARNPPNLRRARQRGNRLFFWFDNITSTEKSCAEFTAHRWFPIANYTITNMYRVYEFYEPMNHNTSIYTTYQLFTLDICEVCGSYQCPYCPYYNTGSVVTCSVYLLILAFIATTTYNYSFSDS